MAMGLVVRVRRLPLEFLALQTMNDDFHYVSQMLNKRVAVGLLGLTTAEQGSTRARRMLCEFEMCLCVGGRGGFGALWFILKT